MALAQGFDATGVTSAGPLSARGEAAMERVREGLLDGMPWLTEERVRRGVDPGGLLPGARSVVSLALNYYSGTPQGRVECEAVGKIARYAWGRDYHGLISRKLAALLEALHKGLGRRVGSRAYVDTGPLLERAVAERAGVGWFGKSTNLLAPRWGSWVFLAEVLLDVELEEDLPLKKGCGNCTACISACPTGAIVAPYVVDARRCIAFHTIENRGAVPRGLRPHMGNWVFGCDVCQEACPVNWRLQKPSAEAAFHPRDGEDSTPGLAGLLRIGQEEFALRFRRSAVRRAGHVGLLRNACVAAGNSSDRGLVADLASAMESPEPLVRGHAAWALGRLGGREARLALERALQREREAAVVEEMRPALEGSSL